MKRREFVTTALAAGLASGGAPSRALGLAPPSAGPKGDGAGKKPRIMFYHDSRHPAVYMYEPPMEKEEFEAAVDEIVGTPVDALMYGLADGRTMFHDTKVSEVLGDPVKKWPHLIFRRAHQNARMMLDSGRDPLRIICERARAKGVAIYPTLLVNQGRRGTREDDVRSSNFRWENLHLEIGAKGDLEDLEGSTNLDFKHQEVRDERFAVIDEVLRNYPVDGFELQLNYKSPAVLFFHPGEVEQGRPLMTAWIKRVYDAVKASGEGRELAIRVPASIETSHALGLDVREWIRQGIVDVLIGETYQHTMDQQADFRPLVQAAKGSSCRIHGAIGLAVNSDRLKDGPIEITRAVASNCWDQGVDGLYLAQWFAAWPYEPSFYERLREVGHPDIMAPRDKFYYASTQSVFSPKPSEPKPALPRTLKMNQPVQVPLPIADDLDRWDKAGRVHEVLLRLRLIGSTETDQVRFRLNGKELPDSGSRKINRYYSLRAPLFRVHSYWFVWRLPREHWPERGSNQVEATLLRRDADIVPELILRDVEMEIKYLGGKNFARGQGGQDPDAGSYLVHMS